MRNKFRESNQIVHWINKTNYHFNNTRMLMSAFFNNIFQQNFKVQKSVFMKLLFLYKRPIQ